MTQCTADSMLLDPEAVGPVQPNRPLAPLTHYRLGGPAQWFVRPQSIAQLAEIMSRCRQSNRPFRILGKGANVLVDDDGVQGAVVRLDAPCFSRIEWTPDYRHSEGGLRRERSAERQNARFTQKDQGGQNARPPRDDQGGQNVRPPREEPVIVRVGAGADMGRLTLDSVKRGLTGLECMAGIPGSIGGIIRMNAGGRWGEISTVVRDVSAIDPSGNLRMLSRDEVGFTYRHTLLDGFIVCEATLQLTPDDPVKVQERYDAIWAAKKAAQPLAAHSAGCVFKNPPGDSAGRLIDAAGLKNCRVGTALVSPEHANFIVAVDGGRAGDVLDLIGLVRRTVADKFAVDLQLEIDVWR